MYKSGGSGVLDINGAATASWRVVDGVCTDPVIKSPGVV